MHHSGHVPDNLCRAGPAADADPQGNQESVYSVFLILCSLCESFCYDVSVHPFCNRKPDHGNCRICGRGDPCLDRRKSVPCFHWCLCSSLYCGDDFALKSEQTCAEACKPLENIDKNRKQIYNAFIVCQKTGDGEQFIIGIE